MATAAIKPSAETACRLCRGGAVKTEGQWPINRGMAIYAILLFYFCHFGRETNVAQGLSIHSPKANNNK